jgi:hypothetical protein
MVVPYERGADINLTVLQSLQMLFLRLSGGIAAIK